MLQWYGIGKIKPHIDKRYALADAPKALEAIMKREVKGKVVIDM
jgi:NADPH2:quinone reductase